MNIKQEENEDVTDIHLSQKLYRLIISQLLYDGHQTLAVSLSNTIQAHPPCPPSNKLVNVVRRGFKVIEDETEKERLLASDLEGYGDPLGPGIDLDVDADVQVTAPEASMYEICYVTSHRAPCRAAAFHPSGTVVVTGAADACIKVLDVDRMLAKGVDGVPDSNENMPNHPVIRTIYDHAEEVTCLEFHPGGEILASGSRDFTVKFFDYGKTIAKKASKTIQEADPVFCFNFHPSGDYMIVGTEHPTIRLYDVHTSQCFVAYNPRDQHTAAVTCINWSTNAKLFVSGSRDGAIKVWDGISNKCIMTFPDAHDKEEIFSVGFSRNSKYILSSGRDSIVRLWELSTARCLLQYTGAGANGKHEFATQATFNHTEDFVLFPDEKTQTLCCWDARSTARQRLLNLSHSGPIRCFVHAPATAMFVSAGDDSRARFWVKRRGLLT